MESYLGLDTVVKRAHPEANVSLTYINQPGGSTDGGDQYTGLDRFGRVIDQLWQDVTGVVTDRFQYSYDADGNTLTRTNAVNGAFSEQYSYDQFNQLISFMRGSHTQSWNLDPLGNWTHFTNDGAPQDRTNNLQNQITSITGASTPTYDNNGNTTTDERGVAYTYDAWNRLVGVNVGATTPMKYDALGRRIQDDAGTQLYYSAAWQVIEEQVGGVMQAQYVWSPVYVDALVERDTNTGQRLYVQQDADWNVTAVDGPGVPAWAPVERYVYDPYGATTVLDPTTWTTRSSQYNWVYLYQGGRYDNFSGLYNFRKRDYSPTLGRWMQPDSMGYGDGGNLYEFVEDSPVNYTDPAGLQLVRPAPAPRPVFPAAPPWARSQDPVIVNPLDLPPEAYYPPGYDGTRITPPSTRDLLADEARRLGIPEDEIQDILRRTYLTKPGDPDPIAKNLRSKLRKKRLELEAQCLEKAKEDLKKQQEKYAKIKGTDQDPCKDYKNPGPYAFLALIDKTAISPGALFGLPHDWWTPS